MQKTKDFDELLHRYLTGRASTFEKIKMDAWLETVRTRYNRSLRLTGREEKRLAGLISDPSVSVEEVVAFKPCKSIWGRILDFIFKNI